jgi:hypothetical protein
MFDRKRPCANCPFRIGMGSRFRLHAERLEEIRAGQAFQCHKTVEYADEEPLPGDTPQQCAGLMAVLAAQGTPNTIMQIGERLGAFAPDELEHQACYGRWAEVLAAHLEGREPDTTN